MKLLCNQEIATVSGANGDSLANMTSTLVNMMGLPTECIRPYSNRH